jgi:hypothetical protein
MTFETPNITLVGKLLEAEVHDETGIAPNRIIKAGSPWSVHIKWEMKGTNWQMVAGKWHVHLNLESMGPGNDYSLVDFADPDCQNQALPSPTGEYTCHFDVPGNLFDDAAVPHQGLVMKLVVLLTYVDPLGGRGPVAAFHDTGMVLIYED